MLNNVKNQFNGNIELYPNPTANFVNVKSDVEVKNISIIDLNGKEVINISNSNRAEVSNLSNGYYIIQVQLSEGIWREALMIQK